jgi:SAM-dependent methyltransferase
MQDSDIQTLWDARAEGYDHYAPDHGLLDADTRQAWKDLLRTWLPSTPGLVGDFGCGTGTLSVLAAELGHEVQAFDFSPRMVDRARAKTAQFGAAVQVMQADISDPPVPGATLDAALARHVLFTLRKPEAALRRWAEAVRPGGRLVLVEGYWGDDMSTDEIGPGDAVVRADTGRPWRGGVRAADLRRVVEPLASAVRVVPLDDPAYWGGQTEEQRYLLVADVLGRPAASPA